MTEPVSSAPPPPQSNGVPWVWPAVALFALSLLGLGAHLGDELIEGEHFSSDTAILLALRVPGHPQTPVGPAWLLQSAVDISALGGYTLLWLFGIAGLSYLLYAGKRAEAGWIAASLIGSSVIDGLLKSWIARPRPELVPHLVQVAHPSFPSGHAMISAAVYLTLALMLAEAEPGRGAKIALVGFFSVLVVLIGCSRVYLGVHWPSDVLAGWCFGTVWALLVWAADRWMRSKRESR
ncbi:MAG: phosphatase PAP2 family protein [Pseudomonadota bacterium]